MNSRHITVLECTPLCDQYPAFDPRCLISITKFECHYDTTHVCYPTFWDDPACCAVCRNERTLKCYIWTFDMTLALQNWDSTWIHITSHLCLLCFLLISAFVSKGLNTMSRACLNRPDNCHGRTLDRLALCNPKIGPPVVWQCKTITENESKNEIQKKHHQHQHKMPMPCQ